jgi:hypothetical protein
MTMINKIPKEERMTVLKKYEQYDFSRKDINYEYKTVMKKREPLALRKYYYYEFMEGIPENTDECAFRLLDFVSTHFIHDGAVSLPLCRRMEDIIKASEEAAGRTNCRGLSIILAELLRINGIKARHVTCKPYEEPFTDCHVVVDCILPYGQRVMLDPTYNLYLKDEIGHYISLESLREGIVKGNKFFINENASYNGKEFNLSEYIEYMAKNTIRFSSNLILGDVPIEHTALEIELIPAGYPINGFSFGKKFVYHPKRFWNI